MESAAKAQGAVPLEGLYGFVRSHLVIVNAVAAASITIVGVLDFLAPTLSVLPKVIYSATAFLVGLMLISAFAPALAMRLISTLGLAARYPSSGPLWRRPAWQIAFAMLLGVTVLGFVSVAKASQGGVIASAFPSARNFQESLLSMREDVADIKSGVGQANEKLDRLASVVDPSNAADRCADLGCAISNGASPEAVKRLFAKGAQLPGNPVSDGALLIEASLLPSQTRFEILDLLAQKGIDRNLMLLPILVDSGSLTKQGALAAMEVRDAANLAANPAAFVYAPTGNKGLDTWNAVVGCFKRTSGGVTLIELASLMGDSDLVAHLHARGAALPARPLSCSWRVAGKSGIAIVRFDPSTGKYAGVAKG